MDLRADLFSTKQISNGIDTRMFQNRCKKNHEKVPVKESNCSMYRLI